MHTHSPNEPKKFKQTLNNQKVMATVFRDERGVLLVEFMIPGTTILILLLTAVQANYFKFGLKNVTVLQFLQVLSFINKTN